MLPNDDNLALQCVVFLFNNKECLFINNNNNNNKLIRLNYATVNKNLKIILQIYLIINLYKTPIQTR